MSANIIAEALAVAEAATDDSVCGACRYAALPVEHMQADACDGEFDDIAWAGTRAVFEDLDHDVLMVRLDVVEAALAHLAERLERAEAKLEAVSREGWRACGLLASLREAVSDVADYYVDTPGAGQAAAERIRAALAEDAAREAKP